MSLEGEPGPRSLAGTRALVTGGLGFLGSNLVHALVRLGAEVTVVDALVPDAGGNRFNVHGVEDRVRLHILDMAEECRMAELIRGQDLVFNLAGQVSHIDSMRDPYTDLAINCRAQLGLLEACRKHAPAAKLVFAGSRQQYGRPDYLPVDERHPLRPTDVNGIHKVAGEAYHLLYGQVYGLRVTSLRLTNTYGPRQLMRHGRQGFVPWFVRLALERREIPVFGDGAQLRDFTFASDAVAAFLLAGLRAEADGEVFNLGGEAPYSLRHFVETLLGVCGGGSSVHVPFPDDRRRIDIGSYYADTSKIRETLGWQPRVPLEEGLRRTVEYYVRHRDHYW